MADGSAPKLHLVLTPRATSDGEITSLHFTITLQGLTLHEGDFLCTYGRHDETHTSRLHHFLRGIPATLADGDGSLPFLLAGDEEKQVRLARDTIGDVAFTSDAKALGADEGSLDVGALRCDQGGIVGVGRHFLPRFSLGSCQVVLEWDVSDCPEGTRVVCSFGEGPGPVEVSGDDDTILDCIFMAGPIRSCPPGGAEPLGTDPGEAGFGGTYWFGELPQNLDAVKDYATNIFPRMAEHFKDEAGSYRTFLTRVARGLKGTALRSSAIVGYDEDTKDEQDWDLIRLLNRAMVSTWARLDPEDDGAQNNWFTDGLSHLYTVFLPFRFGQRGPDYFRATVNAFLSAYFTNPLISRPLAALASLDADGRGSWYAAPAQALRAFVYVLKMDTYTRRAARSRGVDMMRPMDELVRELCARRGAGQKVRREDWLEGMAHWLGREDAERYFREMLVEGRVNELDDMLTSFGETYGPQVVEQEMLEFGFDRASLDEGVVRGVVEGSRAAGAGLRDGDIIMWYSRPEICEIDPERKFRLFTERHDEQVKIEYRPRSKVKVRCWQVLERPRPTTDEDG